MNYYWLLSESTFRLINRRAVSARTQCLQCKCGLQSKVAETYTDITSTTSYWNLWASVKRFVRVNKWNRMSAFTVAIAVVFFQRLMCFSYWFVDECVPHLERSTMSLHTSVETNERERYSFPYTNRMCTPAGHEPCCSDVYIIVWLCSFFELRIVVY